MATAGFIVKMADYIDLRQDLYPCEGCSMSVKDRKLPIIQKTEDGELLNIDGTPFCRLQEDINDSFAGELWQIPVEIYNLAVKGRKILTWDCTNFANG